MILPVLLAHADNPGRTVLTYALLDNMSDSCFITTDLIDQLKLKVQTVDLEVTTIIERKTIRTDIAHNLIVRGVYEQSTLTLPKMYGNEKIPIEKSLIPRPGTLKCWPHLQTVAENLHPFREDVNVGLLIGANASGIIRPQQVIAAGHDDPYAIKTALGWGVIGWMKAPDSDAQQKSHFAYKTSTREVSRQEMKSMFELEFNEISKADDQKISVEDRKFINIAKRGILQCDDKHLELPLPLKDDITG